MSSAKWRPFVPASMCYQYKYIYREIINAYAEHRQNACYSALSIYHGNFASQKSRRHHDINDTHIYKSTGYFIDGWQ